MHIKGLVYFIISLLIVQGIFGQTYIIYNADTSMISEQNPDSTSLSIMKTNWLLEKINEGYLYASIDSISYLNDKFFFHSYVGPKYKWSEMLFVHSGDTFFINRPELEKVNEYLRNLTNEGFPFASMAIKDIAVENDEVFSLWEVISGPYIQFDSVYMIQNVPVKNSYLQKLLDLSIGSPYSEKKYRNLEKKIETIPFLSLNKRPDIAFEKGKAIVYLDLNYENTSSFDGVVGLLPNQSEEGGTLLTGYINLGLKNLFKSGKNFTLEWQRFAEESQQTELSYFHPFVFNSNVGFNSVFSLVKQDTSFLNRMIQTGISTQVFTQSEIALQYEFNGSQVQGDQHTEDQRLSTFSTHWYTIKFGKPDFSINLPKKGISYDLTASLGQRNLENQAGDTISSKSSSLRVVGSFDLQYLINPKFAFFTSTNLGLLRNRNLYQNELFRLGGFNTFRGFNENEFFLSDFTYQNTELRYYFDQRSVIFALYDTGYLSSQVNKSISDWYYAFGFGLALKNNNGLFSIIFATGNSYGNSVSVNNTKVHFGYTAFF